MDLFTEWHKYSNEDPPDDMIGKILRVKVNSVSSPGYSYEIDAKWEGICFMTLDDKENPKSWSGPLKLVTHWVFVEKMQWQSIETAPRDGSRILAWSNTREYPYFIRWFKNSRSGKYGWNDNVELDQEMDLLDDPPTHWMKIPNPPFH